MNNAKYQRERRARLIAAGLCVWCGARQAVTGQVRCLPCAAKGNLVTLKRYHRKRPALKALGVSTICHKRTAMPRRVACGVCAETATIRQAERRERRRNER